jgi:hypothetical protein
MMNGAVPRLTFSGSVWWHEVKRDRVACRGGIVLVQETFDVAAAHRGQFAFADLTQVPSWQVAMFGPLMILPRLKFVSGGVPRVFGISHDARIIGALRNRGAPAKGRWPMPGFRKLAGVDSRLGSEASKRR